MLPPLPVDRALRALDVAVVLGLAAYGLARPDGVLLPALAWLVVLLAALAGGGHLVARIARPGGAEPDLGLRAAWGMAGAIALAGPLVALGICTRLELLALVGLGLAGHAWRALTTTARHPAPALWAAARARPGVAVLVAAAAALVALHVAGGAARLDRNPWDDDLAYTPLLRRLLDAGDLVEPFSFRRLGAYGGQTVLQGLAGVRNLAGVNLLDAGLGLLVVVLLLAGHARAVRASGVALGLVLLVVLTLPDFSVTNTAGHWTGVALFLGLYRTLAGAPGGAAPDDDRRAWVAALVAAAACTVRQNFLAVAPLVVVGVLALRTRARGWAATRRAWLGAAVVGAAVLAPYAVAAYRSSGTFLYPLMAGTWNPSIPLRPTGFTAAGELQLLAWCLLDPRGLVVVLPVVAALAFARDARPGRPLPALLAASAVGFVLLVHSLAVADPDNAWRYAFGYVAPLVLAFALEAGAPDAGEPAGGPLALPAVGRWVTLAALLVQLHASRPALARRYRGLVDDLREAAALDRRGDASRHREAARYAAMQAAIPAGARVAVMVDDPAYLDFARNRILNLDTPGFASWAPGLPTFAGAAAWRDYLLGHGVRWVAFVRAERSRYFFRRPFWVERVFTDAEFFQVMSAHVLDAIDTLDALATPRAVRFDEDGLVVVDLEAAP